MGLIYDCFLGVLQNGYSLNWFLYILDKAGIGSELFSIYLWKLCLGDDIGHNVQAPFV